MTGGGTFRHTPLDVLLVLPALGLGGLLLGLVLVPPRALSPGALLAALVLGLWIWWGSNTVSHNHIHGPLFRAPGLNALFSLYLSLVLGVPQRLWRSRHLWHHAGERPSVRRAPLGRLGLVELGLVAALFAGLFWLRRELFLFIYLPGYLLGMLLCTLQGRYEHGGRAVCEEPGISFYGRLYNALWFNDGYHREHHAYPGEHWSRLPLRRADRRPSRFPPILRWLDRKSATERGSSGDDATTGAAR